MLEKYASPQSDASVEVVDCSLGPCTLASGKERPS